MSGICSGRKSAEAEWPDKRWPFWHRYENGKLASKDPLWDAEGKTCLETIEPMFNRLVLFEPTDVAWHAVAPVRGPEMRRTLTVFFWKHADGFAARRDRATFTHGSCCHGGM